MDAMGQEFRKWIERQHMWGQSLTPLDNSRYTLSTPNAKAHVTLTPLANGQEMVELRIERSHLVNPTYLVRFALKDLPRARDLFREMGKAFAAEVSRGSVTVLICSDRDARVRLLSDKIREAVNDLSLSYDVVLCSAHEAFTRTHDHMAIMLAPGMAHLRKRLTEAHPGSAVFPLPQRVVAEQDARIAIQLLLEAIHEIEAIPVPHNECLLPLRPLARDGRVLVLNIMYGDRCVRMGYRVYDAHRPIAQGIVMKARLSMRDIDDLMESLCLKGVNAASLDAIGICVPGVVNCYSMSLPGLGDRDDNLREIFEKRYGAKTYIDNNTNAAAMGCYLLQAEGDSLTLYRHQLGHKNGGQGTIVGGKLVTGRFCLAGEPKFYQRNFKYTDSYAEAVWSSSGLAEVCRNVLLASIGIISPDVAYLAVSTIDDMDALRKSLERKLPVYCIPELVAIDDYRERMYLGEVALCLERLAHE